MGPVPLGARFRLFLESRKPAAHNARRHGHSPHPHRPRRSPSRSDECRTRSSPSHRSRFIDRHLVSRLSLSPIRAQWTSRITEFECNHHFVDVQYKGPFKCWQHRHEFARQSRKGIDGTLLDGTLVRDFVDYEVGFGLLGEILDRLFIARQMRNTFASANGLCQNSYSEWILHCKRIDFLALTGIAIL
jgi:ligand-binding SRPBCC domain-containing protein